jgi:signal transduction histidine kinase
MKWYFKTLLILLLPVIINAQQNSYWEEWSKEQIDSLQLIWHNTTNDTLRMGIARSISVYYSETNLDSGLYYTRQVLALARQLKLKLWEADALDGVGYYLSNFKDYPGSLQAFLAAIKIAEDKETEKNIWQVSRFSNSKDPSKARLTVLAMCRIDLARLYGYTGNVQKQLANRFESLKIAEIVGDPAILSNVYSNLGKDYVDLDKLDSALIFLEKAIQYYDISGFKRYKGGTLSYIGMVYVKKGNYALAKQYFTKAIHESRQVKNDTDLSLTYLYLVDLYSRTGDRDSSLWYAYKGLESAQLAGAPGLLVSAFTSLSSNYKLRNNVDSAFFYQSLALTLKDSINNIERINQFQNIGFNEQLREQEQEKVKLSYQNKIRTNSLAGGLFTLIVIAFFLYRNNRQKQKAKQNIEKAYDLLKSTQSQLIQSEKMASLGELTAGIAHEIQNPLNFVNNFSELSKELIGEMNDELAVGNIQLAKEIAGDIEQNLEKINHHGKRAADIVKGILQHSRTSSGVKEPTDINALADEYLRLAYHGLRAKDKSFNAEFKTEFDESLPKINVIPQDIGRVLLNLINNAFYACSEQSKLFQSSELWKSYQPLVAVSTTKLDDSIQISVKDNGPGIPKEIIDKIFQPFFTTKPTGQGTGLGLSLSYDIVKAHGGEIKVKTKENEGTEFIIELPI